MSTTIIFCLLVAWYAAAFYFSTRALVWLRIIKRRPQRNQEAATNASILKDAKARAYQETEFIAQVAGSGEQLVLARAAGGGLVEERKLLEYATSPSAKAYRSSGLASVAISVTKTRSDLLEPIFMADGSVYLQVHTIAPTIDQHQSAIILSPSPDSVSSTNFALAS